MTLYTHIQFPAFQLPSGRWAKIDMSWQPTVGPGGGTLIGQPYADTAEVMTENPWADGGLPEPTEEAAPDAGLLEYDSVEFTFHNIPIAPGTDDTALYELVMSRPPEEGVWNIRYWISASSAPGSFSTPPQFWGIIEAADPAGDIHSLTEPSWNTYKLVARNTIALGERISVETWLNGTDGTNGYLQHATYDKIPGSGVWIDGIELTHVFHNDGATKDAAVPTSAMRFFLLKDVLYSIGAAMGITAPINSAGTGTGLVGHSWDYISISSPDPDPVETPWDFDDLAIVSALYRSDGTQMVYDQSQSFFSPAVGAQSQASFWTCGNVLEVLKRILTPFGLVAAIRVNTAGVRYLAVREVETGQIANAGTVLRGMQLDAGERAAYGFRVTTAMNSELVEGDGGDRAIDNSFMGATRLRIRWRAGKVGQTDDEHCVFQSIYAWDVLGNRMRSIFKIIPRRAGDEAVTERACMRVPPAVYPNWNSDNLPTPPSAKGDTWLTEASAHEAGSVVAKACMAYYWNGHADPTTDPVGVYRRYMKKLTWKESGVDLIARVGDRRVVAGAEWVIRRKTVNAVEDWTEFEAEKGSYDASS